MKSDFQPSEGLFQSIWEPGRTVIILVGSETEIFSILGDLRKKYLIRQILSSKIKILLFSFMKSDIQSSEGLFQMNWGSTKEFDNPF